MITTISIQTESRDQMIDITPMLNRLLKKSGIKEGIMVVYSPHTTAGITINENADPSVCADFLRRLDEMCPWYLKEDCHYEGNSAAHVKASMVGSSQLVIIKDGKLALGRWQGVYFCEFDGPRLRQCYVKIIMDNDLVDGYIIKDNDYNAE